jgi:ABC-type glycerol-3-phosphate transport system substrate-binding protein
MQWALSEETLVRLGTEGNLVTVSREAVYNNADFIEKNDVGAMRDSLANYAMPQYRPLNPEWPEVADIVSNYISDVFAKQISAEEAMEIANEEVAEVYREAGYIS